MVDGRLQRAVSLQGFYRLTPESADDLAAVLDDTAARPRSAGQPDAGSRGASARVNPWLRSTFATCSE